MATKQEAVNQIVRLVREHGIALREIQEALPDGNRRSGLVTVLMRASAYIGGILFFAGVAIYCGTSWEELSPFARIIITFGAGLLSTIVGLLSRYEERFVKLASPLFLIGALLQTAGLYVANHELLLIHDNQIMTLWITVMVFLQSAIGYSYLKNNVLLFLSFVFAVSTYANVSDLMGINESLSAVVVGSSVMVSTYAMGSRVRGAFSGFWYFVGSAVLFWGGFELGQSISRWIFFPFFPLLAGFVLFGSTMIGSSALLTTSTAALLFYIGHYTALHFVDFIGWPLALVIFGVIFFGVSIGVFQLHKNYIATKGERMG